MIDLRSDTVTRPTEAMRRVMARAEVGDDVFREDPTVRRLEEATAELLGKEAALFVPSGTMANQIALLLHTGRGDVVLAPPSAHVLLSESGAASALAGVQVTSIGMGPTYSESELLSAMAPPSDWSPRVALAWLENTHNHAGGVALSVADVARAMDGAGRAGLARHLDGARIWNACVAKDATPDGFATHFDTASVCFSKSLGAPVGSALVGSRVAVAEARRLRKRLGGGMRQAGVLAAAAYHALTHHRERLHEDHAHARLLYSEIAPMKHVVRVVPPDTNMVRVELAPRVSIPRIMADLQARGLLVSSLAPHTLRLVTHLDVDRPAIEAACSHLSSALASCILEPDHES